MAEGISNFGAISLTQIPGDPDSSKVIKLEVYFGQNLINLEKKLSRDVNINEAAYSEFIEDYKNTYFKEVLMSFIKI